MHSTGGKLCWSKLRCFRPTKQVVRFAAAAAAAAACSDTTPLLPLLLPLLPSTSAAPAAATGSHTTPTCLLTLQRALQRPTHSAQRGEQAALLTCCGVHTCYGVHRLLQL